MYINYTRRSCEVTAPYWSVSLFVAPVGWRCSCHLLVTPLSATALCRRTGLEQSATGALNLRDLEMTDHERKMQDHGNDDLVSHMQCPAFDRYCIFSRPFQSPPPLPSAVRDATTLST